MPETTIPASAIEAAKKWRSKHFTHVLSLVVRGDATYPPSGSDVIRPELWKASHWKWLQEIERRDG